MSEKRNDASAITRLLRLFATIFTMTILSMGFSGMFLARHFYASDALSHGGIFGYDWSGLSFGSIVQVAGLSLALSFFAILLFSERFSAKVRFLPRAFLLYLATMFSVSIFAVAFGWFPLDNFITWISSALMTLVAFSIALALATLNSKQEAKRYNRLLANYKARRKAGEHS